MTAAVVLWMWGVGAVVTAGIGLSCFYGHAGDAQDWQWFPERRARAARRARQDLRLAAASPLWPLLLVAGLVMAVVGAIDLAREMRQIADED